MKRRAVVLLDRDGTISEECGYLSEPGQVRLILGAASALRQFKEMGLGLVIVTNQSAVGRGFFDEARLHLIHRRLYELLEAEGIQLDGIYFCPHKPEDDCSCRKPRTGLVEKASAELDFDPGLSFVIGDKACDIEMGRTVGATTLLVRTGYGAQVAEDKGVQPDHVVEDLQEAAQMIGRLLTRREDPCSL